MWKSVKTWRGYDLLKLTHFDFFAFVAWHSASLRFFLPIKNLSRIAYYCSILFTYRPNFTCSTSAHLLDDSNFSKKYIEFNQPRALAYFKRENKKKRFKSNRWGRFRDKFWSGGNNIYWSGFDYWTDFSSYILIPNYIPLISKRVNMVFSFHVLVPVKTYRIDNEWKNKIL